MQHHRHKIKKYLKVPDVKSRVSPWIKAYGTNIPNDFTIHQGYLNEVYFRRKSKPMVPTYQMTSQSIGDTSTKSTFAVNQSL